MGLGTIVTFVEEIQPVGVAIVQELSLAAQRITGGIIGKDTVFIVFHTLGAGRRDSAVRVQVRGTGHGHILRIDRGRHFAGSTGDTGIIAIEIIESFQPLQTIAHNVVFPLDQTLIERIGAAIRHGNFVTLGLFCGHEDHTISGTGTVDSGGGGILQDSHRFNIVRVHLAQGAFHTVDEHQGAAAVTDTVTGTAGACRTRTGVIGSLAATDIHATGVAGLTIGLDNVQTGNLALQGTRNIAVGTVGKYFTVEVFDRTHQLGFLQGTITHHHRGFQGLRILKEDKIHFGTAIQRFLNGLVSKKLTNQDGRRGGLDRVGTVVLGDITRIGTFHHHGSSDDGFVGRTIDNPTGNRRVLRESGPPQEDSQDSRHTGENLYFHTLLVLKLTNNKGVSRDATE